MTPDWQLPPGVDRGLWDYVHSADLAAGYEAQMAASPLAAEDLAFCEAHFHPGRLIDLGCGTGRLCRHFASKGFDCLGVDLSEEMLAKAQALAPDISWKNANIVDLAELPDATFENAACLFSTLGMVQTTAHREAVIRSAFRLLKAGGCFVVHAHNRWFSGLGWKRFRGSDFPMPQAYGGAALAIHHFSRQEILNCLQSAGFTIREVRAIDINGKRAAGWRRVYGFLIAAGKD